MAFPPPFPVDGPGLPSFPTPGYTTGRFLTVRHWPWRVSKPPLGQGESAHTSTRELPLGSKRALTRMVTEINEAPRQSGCLLFPRRRTRYPCTLTLPSSLGEGRTLRVLYTQSTTLNSCVKSEIAGW